MRQSILSGLVAVTALGAFVLSAAPTYALDADLRCELGKIKGASKYGVCRFKAESKALKRGLVEDFSRCDEKLTSGWTKSEAAGGAQCPTLTDQSRIGSEVTEHTDWITLLLSGAGPDGKCGNAIVESGEDCDLATLDGNDCTTITGGFAGGDLLCTNTCTFDISGCYTDQLVDLGDTIFDYDTGLEWEKKINDGGPRDLDNQYCWEAASCPGSAPGSGNIDEWVALLNNTCDADGVTDCTALGDAACGGGTCGYAGQRDWRIPTLEELASIADYTAIDPAVDAFFGDDTCAESCTDCSCTQSNVYWSSTPYASGVVNAWYVYFHDGRSSTSTRNSDQYVRAVRSD